jgi:hypothetical protein
VRQRADFQEHGKQEHGKRRRTGAAAPLQRFIMAAGARMREALWAAQLIERKAAVARWRTGQFGKAGGPTVPLDKERRR